MHTTPSFGNRIALGIVMASVLLLSACAQPPQSVDPLTTRSEFAVTAANPNEATGALFGLLLRPFQSIGKLDTEDYGAFRNAFVDATLDAEGAIVGTLIAPNEVPQLNDGLFGLAHRSFAGGYGAFLVFFPPEQCPMETTNPDRAALATIPYMFAWDGASLDEEGFPVVDAAVRTDRWEDDFTDGTVTETYEGIALVLSRTAWSASSGGACTFTEEAEEPVLVFGSAAVTPSGAPVDRVFTYDVDVELSVGWQFLHVTAEFVEDAETWTETIVVRTLSLDEVDDLSDVWTVESVMTLGAVTSTRPNPALERLFR